MYANELFQSKCSIPTTNNEKEHALRIDTIPMQILYERTSRFRFIR